MSARALLGLGLFGFRASVLDFGAQGSNFCSGSARSWDLGFRSLGLKREGLRL